MFYANDVATNSSEWLKILAQQGQSEPSEQEVWDAIRCNPEPPHIGNVCMYLILSKIEQWCIDRRVDCRYFINAIDSHLYVDGEAIYACAQFFQLTEPQLDEDGST